VSFIINPYRHAGGGGATNGLLTGLQSYWKLDEASGTIADSHGSNDGTLTGATYGATGVINDCIEFDGSGDDIDFGNIFRFDYDQPFSVSFWANWDADGGSYAIISNTNNSSPYQGWTIEKDSSDRVLFTISQTYTGGNVLDVRSTTTIPASGGWYHVVVTYDGTAAPSGVKIYIDDSSSSLTTIQNTLSSTPSYVETLTIGARDSGAANIMDGKIDEVGVWTRVLTSDEVSDLYNSGSGLAYGDFTYSGEGLLTSLESYYKLDEASGTIADSHGSNDGTANGSPTYGATGKINDCLDFEASSSQYVDLGTGLDFYGHSGVTISAWVKIESFPTSGNLMQVFGNGDTATQEQLWVDFYNNGGTQQIRFGSYKVPGGSHYSSYNHSLSTATWYHLCCVHNGTDWDIYIDGTVYYTTGVTGVVYNNSNKSSIGAVNLSGFTRYFDGLIDEVGVWYRALSSTDVANLYKGGAGMPYSEFTS